MAKMYGIPQFNLDMSIDTIHAELATCLHAHFKMALSTELEQERLTAMQRYREQLHSHGGVNRMVANVLKDKVFVMPSIQVEERIVHNPNEILQEAEQAWSAYYDVDQRVPDDMWTRKYLASLPCLGGKVPNIDGKLLQKLAKLLRRQSPTRLLALITGMSERSRLFRCWPSHSLRR